MTRFEEFVIPFKAVKDVFGVSRKEDDSIEDLGDQRDSCAKSQ